jgi:pantoate--beta-alanine ligase
MKVSVTIEELNRALAIERSGNRTIGLVPTMGALHQGHASLINKCARENDVTVVSIFVNPTQFDDPSDLEKYPRAPEEDLEMLRSLGTDLVFMPDEKEMYPEPDTRVFDLGGLDRLMEGRSRKGHFNGVAQIVSKLFAAVKPGRAYFGQKDFQQLVIIRHLVRLLDLDLEIVACPIIREADGLAMSSRNRLLTGEQRKAAPFIYQTLTEARRRKEDFSPSELKDWVESRFRDRSMFRLDYFEIVDDKDLKPVLAWEEAVNKVGCIAVLLGEIRLIDNIIFD